MAEFTPDGILPCPLLLLREEPVFLRVPKAADKLRKRGVISQTSCGICGKEAFQDLVHVSRDHSLMAYSSTQRIFGV